MRQVVDAISAEPRQIRVLCPKGHFIANITLSAADGHLAMRWLRSRKAVRRKASQQRPVLYGDVRATVDTKVLLECGHRGCGYRGTFNHLLLAYQLAATALAGQREYRVTT